MPRASLVRYGTGAAFCGGVALLPLVLAPYWLYLVTALIVAAVVARSIGVITNQTGMLSLCQLSFAAVGGWVVSALETQPDPMPYPLAVLLGALVALPLGLVIGLPALRIRGVELAVVTLGVAVSADLYLSRGSFPGAGDGLIVLPQEPLVDPRNFFLFCWGVLLLITLLLWGIGRTRMGVAWQAVRNSERATAALGGSVGAAKVTAFGAGAFVAGVAGGLMAGLYGLLTADVFSPLASLIYFAVAIMAGAGTLLGAVLAGTFITMTPEILRRVGLPLDLADIWFALGAIDTLRRGHGGMVEQASAKVQERRFRDRQTVVQMPESTTPIHQAPGAPVLEVTGLRVEYGSIVALADVDLAVRAGEVHALVGPNGAGKSTLIDALTGFVPRYSGSVKLDGVAIDRRSARERSKSGIRRTFQQGRAIESLTLRDYLHLAGARTLADKQRHVDFFGLPALDVPVRLMDAGSRRVVEIAAALASGPSVVLLDEPAAGLDEKPSALLADLIARIPQEFGTAVLLVEHDMPHVRKAATSATVLDFGAVLATGTVDEVLRDPAVVAAYLGEEVPS